MTTNEFLQVMIDKNPTMVAYARKKKLRKLLRVVLFNLLILSITFVTLDQMPRLDARLPILLSAFLICLIYTLTAKPRGLIFAKPCVGVIENTAITTRSVGRDDNVRWMEQRNFVVLSVRTESGENLRIELDSKYASYYRLGDRVGVWSGLPFPILLDAEEGRATVCWWCGGINRPEDVECLHCGRDRFES